MSLLDDVVSSKAQDDGVAQPLDTERKKLKLKGKSRINPPVWWRDNQKQFPVSQKNTSVSQLPLFHWNVLLVLLDI